MQTALSEVIHIVTEQIWANDQRVTPTHEEVFVLPYRVSELTERHFEAIARKWRATLTVADPPCLLKVESRGGSDDPLAAEYKRAVDRYTKELESPQERSTTINWTRLRLNADIWRFDLVIATYSFEVPFNKGRAVIAFTYRADKRLSHPGESTLIKLWGDAAKSKVFVLPEEHSGESGTEADFAALSVVAKQYGKWLEQAIRVGFDDLKEWRNWL